MMSKKTIDLSGPVLALDGSIVQEGLSVGKVLASYLGETDKGDSVRLLTLARDLWKDEPVEVEKDLLDSVFRLLDAPDCPLKNLYSGQIKEALIDVNLNE